MAVGATVASGTIFVPKVLDLLRPAEKERAQQFSGADPEVEAHLGEDRFAAVRRPAPAPGRRCGCAR